MFFCPVLAVPFLAIGALAGPMGARRDDHDHRGQNEFALLSRHRTEAAYAVSGY
jgi:hypothetical protein